MSTDYTKHKDNRDFFVKEELTPYPARYGRDPSLDPQHRTPNTLNLVLEVTGLKRKDKEAKVSTARTLWVPAVNNHGGLGEWLFIEIEDPWDCVDSIRAASPRGVVHV